MEYIGNVDEFPILGRWDFYNHAGVSPLPRRAAEAIRKYAREAEEGAYLGTDWFKDIERLRGVAGRLINAKREEIAFVKNTSEGIATVAGGIDWRAGDRIVTTGVEYPANVYPWMNVAKRFGVELVMVPEETGENGARRVRLERILEQTQHPRTRLVALSHVEFASGQRHDLAAVGRVCREKGKLFCVDAIQSVGVLPVDVVGMGIDFLSADGHKWMLGPEGAGIFYCRKELLSGIRPLIVGWMNVINADDYGHYDFTLKPDAGRFECGTHNVAGLLGMKASIELLTEVGLERVAERVKLLTERVIEGVRRKGYQVVSPRGQGEWSGIVSFVSSKHDHKEIWKRLRKEERIEIAVREGRLRVSPHFYNTEEQVERLVGVLPGH
ncbi:MAG: aminotransferase class V-fold PLP-dependent enzyme [Planctomycetota bacterium]|nr:aminotransferase class V-fold PLP-dependent enzyme [Planctomycetota bacterium]